MFKIFLDDQEFKITVEHKNNKNMYMRLKVNNEIVITCGNNIPNENIYSFITSKKQWILKANLRLIEKSKNNTTMDLEKNYVNLLGKRYEIKVGNLNIDSFEIRTDEIIINSKLKTAKAINDIFYLETTKLLTNILKKQRVKWDSILDDYNLPYPNITIKKMRGKWGSCTPIKNDIKMNYSLICTPLECINYVLLHEYVHLIVPNHSKRFYDLVLYHMPEYKKFKKMLNEV